MRRLRGLLECHVTRWYLVHTEVSLGKRVLADRAAARRSLISGTRSFMQSSFSTTRLLQEWSSRSQFLPGVGARDTNVVRCGTLKLPTLDYCTLRLRTPDLCTLRFILLRFRELGMRGIASR